MYTQPELAEFPAANKTPGSLGSTGDFFILQAHSPHSQNYFSDLHFSCTDRVVYGTPQVQALGPILHFSAPIEWCH